MYKTILEVPEYILCACGVRVPLRMLVHNVEKHHGVALEDQGVFQCAVCKSKFYMDEYLDERRN